MTPQILNEALIEAMKSKIEDGTGLANMLINVLQMRKEAVYRRLRGEVPFTFSEAAIISKELGISLDTIIGSKTTKNAMFGLNIADTSDAINAYRQLINYYYESTKAIKALEDTEIGIAANLIPQIFYLKYDNLSKFRIFKWLYQSDKTNSLPPYSEFDLPDDISELQNEYVKESQYIKKTTYILDNQIINNLIKDIQYFVNIHLINREDVELIKKDLMLFLDDLEEYASKGKFSTGMDLHIYISNVNFEATYSYISSPLMNIAAYRLYSINTIMSSDPVVYNYNKDFILSLKKYSTLISESAEIHRVKYFNKQRELVRSL